jgi:hypothetical protein
MRITNDIQFSPDVVTRQLGEEMVLLNLASGTYYGIDPCGARFIALVKEGKTPLEARDILLDVYDVDPAVLDTDLEALLESLSSHGVIIPMA